MPFITDRMQANEEEQEKNKMMAEEKRQANITRSRFVFKTDTIVDKLKISIFGQDEMIEQIENLLRVVRVDITEQHRPLYIALFLGPTGVGKTETVRILAQSIYGDRESLCRIDMNTLAQEHYAAAITGAPPGYVGSKEGNTLFDEEKIKGSFSKPGIVLFDEIEKADKTVIQSLLNVMDNGKLLIASGDHTIDFRNSMIFMTSNLGSKEIIEFSNNSMETKLKKLFYRIKSRNWSGADHAILNRIIKKQLEQNFSPEFLNRIDDILIFNFINDQSVHSIIDKLTAEMNKRLEKHHVELVLTTTAKDFLVKNGYDKQYGVRALKRCVRKYLEIPLADILEHSHYEEKVYYSVSVDGKQLDFHQIEKGE
jgi:ATP-dependent Clp protease ATP-binding subunit ClpA